MSMTPHGPGFSFLDALEVIEPGKRARGHKWLDPASSFFAEHFPGNPLMPGVLLIECAAQAAGTFWLQQHSNPQQTLTLAFLASVQQFRFVKAVLPNQTVQIEVVLEKDFGALAQFETVLRVEGAIVAQGKLAISRSLK